MTTPHYDPNSGQYGTGPAQPGQPSGYGPPSTGYGQPPAGPAPGGQAPGGYAPPPSAYGEAPSQSGSPYQQSGPGFAMPKGTYQQPTKNLSGYARRRGLIQVLIGAVIFVIGLAITIGTYHAASTSSSGGTYFVAYGPMIAGLIAVVRGLITLARASKLN